MLDIILFVAAVIAAVGYIVERRRRIEAETAARRLRLLSEPASSARPVVGDVTIIERVEAPKAPQREAPVSFPPDLPPHLGPILGLDYVNAQDERSKQEVLLMEVQERDSGLYIVARPVTGDMRLTYRVDRIMALHDIAAGRPIHNPDTYFARYIEPPEAPPAGHASVITRARPGLRVLVWIARAEGRETEDDLAALVEYIRARASIRSPAGDFDEDLARQSILDDRVTFDDAAGAVARVKRGGAEWRLIGAFADRIASHTATPGRAARRERLLG